MENAITEKTKAIMLAHTLGNPFNLEKIMEIAKVLIIYGSLKIVVMH